MGLGNSPNGTPRIINREKLEVGSWKLEGRKEGRKNHTKKKLKNIERSTCSL